MLDDFLTYIREQSLFQKNEQILLAVSGGVDSVVLTHLFAQAGYSFGIAHCDFSLRGKDSDGDKVFTEQLSNSLDVAFHSIKFDTEEYANTNKISIQMAARELRYQWFEKILKEHHYQYIATAHHHSDSIETVLFNISKGTGISGVRGIQSKNETITRPLLFATKTEIERYAKKHHLKCREDVSNSSDKYHRNYIRHHVVPALEHINPSFEVTTKVSLERLKDAEEIVKASVRDAKEQIIHINQHDYYINKEKLKSLSGNTTILHLLIKSFGFNYKQCRDIISHIDESGKLYLSKTHQANIDREHLIISPLYLKEYKEFIINKGEEHISAEDITLEITETAVPQKIPTEPNIGYFDFDKIAFPLTVRLWQQGDKFHPLGMTQQKKVSDFLIDSKVPINLKERVKVITSNGRIIWVIGHRIDDRVKITKSTTQALHINLKSTS